MDIVKFLFKSCRNYNSLIFKYKMIASYDYLFLAYTAADSVGNYIVNLGMHLLVLKPLLPCSLYNCICHGMREMLLKTGCYSKELILSPVFKGDNRSNHRLRLGKCTCFVKNYGVCSRNCL